MGAPEVSPVLLYDGVCGFCDGMVQFVLRHDRRGTLRFATLQGAYGHAATLRHAELRNIDSVVWLETLPENGTERVLTRSDAAIRVAEYLGGPWRLVLASRVIPQAVRDSLYDLFAHYRYRIFGKRDRCAVPPPGSRARFLDG